MTAAEKAKFYFVIPHICLIIGSLVLLCVSFAYNVIGRKDAIELKSSFTDLVANWDEDMIYGITNNANYVLPTKDHYLKRWNGLWPGTVAGCYCTQSSRTMNVQKGLKSRTCNNNETRLGCSEIASTPAKDLNKWLNSEELQTIRIKGTSFLDNYNQIDETGKCKDLTYTNCGSLSSKAKGLCLPNKYGACPLTDIKSTAQAGYTPVAFNGFTFYTSNSQANNPICDAYIREHHLCFVRSSMPLTPGRSKYDLFNGDYKNCIEDKTTWSLGSMGEKTYFDLNQVNYQGLKTFTVDDTRSWNLLNGRMLDWSPGCSDTVPTLTAKKDEFEVLVSRYTNMVIVYSIALALIVISSFGILCSVFTKNRQLFKVMWFVKLLWFVMALPPIVIVFVKAQEFYKYFEKIVQLQCSNDDTNGNFMTFTDVMKYRLKNKTSIVLGLIVAMFAIDLIQCIVFLFLSMPAPPEKDQQNTDKSSGLEPYGLFSDTKINSVVPTPNLPLQGNNLLSPEAAKNNSSLQEMEKLKYDGSGGKSLSISGNSGTNNISSPTPADGNKLPPGFITAQAGQDPLNKPPLDQQPVPPGFKSL